MAFSNNNATNPSKTVSRTYTISKDTLYDVYKDDIPWKNERNQIKYIDFVNKIVPTNTALWFWKCENILEINNMGNLNTGKIISMYGMFSMCSKLTNLDVSHFNTKNVTNMSAVFFNCSSLTSLDVSSFNTGNVTTMRGMFYGCSSLTSLDLSKFDTSKVTDMGVMFSDSPSLTSLDISSFDTTKVTDMGNMFGNCSSLTSLDISSFDTTKVTNMDNMFDMPNNGTSKLKTVYVSDKFVTTNVTTSNYMFCDCILLVGGNGTTWNSSKVNKEYARIDKAGQPGYFTYKSSSN